MRISQEGRRALQGIPIEIADVKMPEYASASSSSDRPGAALWMQADEQNDGNSKELRMSLNSVQRP